MLKDLFKAREVAPPGHALYARAVEAARRPDWYVRGHVPDTLDGRFDMIALVVALVLLRLERDADSREGVLLTERFIADMDASLRETGVGDMSMGRHVGRMVSALGGRLGAYREGLAGGDLRGALVRNVYRGDDPGEAADWLAAHVAALAARVDAIPVRALSAGEVPL